MRPTPSSSTRTSGFSLVELVVAVTVFSVGLLGMGTTMLYSVRSVSMADLATERAAARQAGIEHLRAMPYGSLAIGQDSVGSFEVAWGPLSQTPRSTRMRVITLGPGRSSGASGSASLVGQVADTLDFLVLKP